VNPRNLRYYVDLALVPVVVVCLILLLGSVWSWPPTTWSKRDVVVASIVLAVSIVLAQQRRLVLGASLGYVVVRALLGVGMNPRHVAVLLPIAVGAGLGCFAVLWPMRNRKVDYDRPNRPTDLVIFCAVFGCVAVALAVILRDTIRFYLR